MKKFNSFKEAAQFAYFCSLVKRFVRIDGEWLIQYS